MNIQLIAVAIDENNQIAQQAGRARHWHVYSVDPGTGEKSRVWELALAAPGCLHEWHLNHPGNLHPLHHVHIAIAGSAGEGVYRRLLARDTRLITTTECDPLAAMDRFLEGSLPVGPTRAPCGSEDSADALGKRFYERDIKMHG